VNKSILLSYFWYLVKASKLDLGYYINLIENNMKMEETNMQIISFVLTTLHQVVFELTNLGQERTELMSRMFNVIKIMFANQSSNTDRILIANHLIRYISGNF
jgi:hypothetical protein